MCRCGSESALKIRLQDLSSLAERGWNKAGCACIFLWVCMEVSVCLLPLYSIMSTLAKECYPLHPDSCSLNTEEWPWIFPNCTHIRRHSVLRRTPAIPTLSGETSVPGCSIQTVRPVVCQLHPACHFWLHAGQRIYSQWSQIVLENLLLCFNQFQDVESLVSTSYSIFHLSFYCF